MKRPLYPRSEPRKSHLLCARGHKRNHERGITMALVAICMVAILAMAVLSIDTVTLYLAREEAQRTADTAALAGARILSLSGITGDPQDATNSWSPACTAATDVATAVAQQNQIAGLSLPAAQIAVTFPNNPGCAGNLIFGVNPEVAVKVTRQNLPSFFARIWGVKSNTVTASATAEAYNPSNSANFTSSGTLVPVQTHCVKPWIVPNQDPGNSGNPFVDPTTGIVTNQGVNQLNGGVGVIGEEFTLTADCQIGATNCGPAPVNMKNNPPQNTAQGLEYVPALVQASSTAAASCATADDYQQAIGGCDQSTVYACGTTLGATVDLTINPGGAAGDTATATQCLIHGPGGQDSLQRGSVTTPIYPFQIWAGLDNPLVKSGIVNNNDVITSSSSIVTLPIYNSSPPTTFTTNQPAVTITGFLQVFVNSVGLNGDLDVSVLNVSGCGNTGAPPAAVSGTSPVPIRLITQ